MAQLVASMSGVVLGGVVEVVGSNLASIGSVDSLYQQARLFKLIHYIPIYIYIYIYILHSLSFLDTFLPPSVL